ncbi:hypothetical protein IPM19_04145 [bacterium]|nr:MAG: hypothetical protein IPM19_04145 [bacterium]
MNKLKILKYSAGVIFIALAVLLLWWAYRAGQHAGQSRQAVKDANAIKQALEYFYQDQNRYPATDEFKDDNLMRQYVSGFPPKQYPSEQCPATFQYSNNFRNDYELRLCLTKGVSGFKEGVNIIKAPVK